MNTANRFISAGCMLALTLQLAACGSDKPNTKAAESQAPAVKKEPVEITVYSPGWEPELVMDIYGRKIQEKFPHVTIKVLPREKLDTLTNAGVTIDLILASVGTTTDVLQSSYQQDISDLIKKYKFDLNRLEPTSIQFQKQISGGGIYGLPGNTTTLGFFYNKDIFDKFGVPYPKNGMTWDETYELARKLTRNEGGTQYIGYSMSSIHALRLNQLTMPMIDAGANKAAFGDAKQKTYFETMGKFAQISGYGGSKDLDNKANFTKTKTIAMQADLIGSAPNFTKEGVNWDAVSLPVFKEAPGIGPQSYPNYFYITRTSKLRDQAFEILTYVTSDEMQTYVTKKGYISILKDSSVNSHFAEDVPELKGKQAAALVPAKFAEPTVFTPQYGLAEKRLHDAFKQFSDGKKDVNTALREAEELANKDIEVDLKK